MKKEFRKIKTTKKIAAAFLAACMVTGTTATAFAGDTVLTASSDLAVRISDTGMYLPVLSSSTNSYLEPTVQTTYVRYSSSKKWEKETVKKLTIKNKKIVKAVVKTYAGGEYEGDKTVYTYSYSGKKVKKVQETVYISGKVSEKYVTKITYNKKGRIKKTVLSEIESGEKTVISTVKYTYNSKGNLKKVTSDGKKTASFTYSGGELVSFETESDGAFTCENGVVTSLTASDFTNVYKTNSSGLIKKRIQTFPEPVGDENYGTYTAVYRYKLYKGTLIARQTRLGDPYDERIVYKNYKKVSASVPTTTENLIGLGF